MQKLRIVLFMMILTMLACKESSRETKIHQSSSDNSSVQDFFSIEIIDKEALAIIDPKATIEVRASGFTWTEGPLWIEDGKYLLFSDIPNNKVYKLDSNNDTITYLHPSGYSGKNAKGSGSNGLLLDHNQKLVLMQQGDRRIARMTASLDKPKEQYEPLVDRYMGKRLNSPNDGVFDKQGNLYFTDPPYGLPQSMNDPNKELDFQGIYSLMKTGGVMLLDSLSRPNGIALSPDESLLYVAVSDRAHAVWYCYDIVAPGKINNKRIFYDISQYSEQNNHESLPDGMKVNSKGYVFASGSDGVWIFNPAGIALARIHTGQHTSNCALTTDEKQLFITADDYILSVALK